MAAWLAPALASLVVPIVLGWLLSRGNQTGRWQQGRRILRYGVALKTLSLVLLAISLAFIAGATFATEQRLALLLLAGLFGILGLPLLLEFFFVGIGHDEEAIYCRSPWRRARVIPWDDLSEIRFSTVNKLWVITTRSHGTLRLQLLMDGADGLRREIERRLGVADTLAGTGFERRSG